MKLKSAKPTTDQRNLQSILFNLHYKPETEEVKPEGIGNNMPGNVMVQDLSRLTTMLMHTAVALNDSGYAARRIDYLCEQDQFVQQNYQKYNCLTPREKEIIRLIAEGNNSCRISDLLFISLHTVNNHRKNIARKLDVKSLSELIKFALAFFIL